MITLFHQIQQAVAEDRYLFGIHATEQIEERGIETWQVVHGIADGRLLVERPKDIPNPVVEIEQILADGTAVKAVWAWIAQDQTAKLVTVHFFDR